MSARRQRRAKFFICVECPVSPFQLIMATLHPRTGGDGFIRDKNNGLCRTTGAVTASCAYHAQGGWLHAAVCHGVDVGRLGAGISAGGRAHPAVTAVATPRHCLCKPDAWHTVAGTGV